MAYEQRGGRDFGPQDGGRDSGRDGGREGGRDGGDTAYVRGRGKRELMTNILCSFARIPKADMIPPGSITDYGSTMVHWMRNRQPRYKGAYQGEAERPSASYIVDVGDPL